MPHISQRPSFNVIKTKFNGALKSEMSSHHQVCDADYFLVYLTCWSCSLTPTTRKVLLAVLWQMLMRLKPCCPGLMGTHFLLASSQTITEARAWQILCSLVEARQKKHNKSTVKYCNCEETYRDQGNLFSHRGFFCWSFEKKLKHVIVTLSNF